MDRIKDGVFFTHPGDLPRGRHVLAHELVLERQRERLMISVTEQVAARGYRAVGVREIAGRARISQAAFYECFDNKDACVFAAYDRFIAVLVDQVAEAVAAPTHWDAMVAGVVGAYLDKLSSDLVVARAFQVEMDALGRPARDKRQEALRTMALLLKSRRDDLWPGAEDLPLSAYLGAIYAVRQLSSDRIDHGGAADLDTLRDESQTWLAQLLRVPSNATSEPSPSDT